MVMIALVGDSVLDNFYWLEEKDKDLRFRIRELGYSCENYAVDESRLDDVIDGIIPRSVYSSSRSYPYPGEIVIPLDLIEKLNPDVIVLSIGGNDLRVNLLSISFGVEHFIKTVLTKDFINNYRLLLQTLKHYCKKLIVVSIYCPCISEGLYSFISFLADPVMNSWFNFLNPLCREFNVPILDLNRTLDRNNRAHYGSTTIEPSDSSNRCIAKCIEYIEKNYEGYKIYYAPDCNVDRIVVC
jgi:hypothetical protein